jgi:glycosyltransferase involved in cell wall biosynthesis
MILSVPIPPFEGIGTHVIGLSRRLRERGHKVMLLTRGKGGRYEAFEHDRFPVFRVPFWALPPCHVHIHGHFVRRWLKSFSPQPDLVHLHSPLVPAVPRHYPIVTTFHSPTYADFSHLKIKDARTFFLRLMGRTVSYRIEKRLLRISDQVIVVHENVRKIFQAYYNRSRNYHVIPNVVDPHFFLPPSGSSAQRKPYLLYIGRLGYGKGLQNLLDSARQVLALFPDLKYVLVGTGPLEKMLRKQAEAWEFGSRFEFRGMVQDPGIIRQCYQEAAAVLLPSHHEGSPLVLWEALACGKAIVAAAAGFETGILKDGENALLIKPKSSQELTAATIRLLSSPELRIRLGEAARQTALAKIDLNAHTDAVESVYFQALERWRRRSGLGAEKQVVPL